MSNPKEKMTVETGGNTSTTVDRYQLEVKTGRKVDGVTPTVPVRLLIQWEDVMNTPTIMCIDGGDATGSKWGTLTEFTVED